MRLSRWMMWVKMLNSLSKTRELCIFKRGICVFLKRCMFADARDRCGYREWSPAAAGLRGGRACSDFCIQNWWIFAFKMINSLFKMVILLMQNIKETFELTFTHDTEEYGILISKDLKPGGAHIPVTNANRAEYLLRGICIYNHAPTFTTWFWVGVAIICPLIWV